MPARTQRDTGNGAVVRRRILAAVLLTAVVIGLTVLLPRTQSPQGESGTSPRGYPAPVLLQLRQQCLVMPGTKESFCDCAVARLQEKYSYAEFQKLSPEQAERAGLDASFACGEGLVIGGIRATIVVPDTR